jgi:large subunit ribosomal protein L9
MANYNHVVLTEDLPNVGKSGELVKVRPGFARNYLVPRGLAVSATQENVARIEHEKKVAEARATKVRGEAEELSKKLGAVKLTIARPVGEGDRLYGSVTARDIEEALEAQGFRVDRRRIETEPLKALGTFQVPIRLATSISATIEVTVTKK